MRPFAAGATCARHFCNSRFRSSVHQQRPQYCYLFLRPRLATGGLSSLVVRLAPERTRWKTFGLSTPGVTGREGRVPCDVESGSLRLQQSLDSPGVRAIAEAGKESHIRATLQRRGLGTTMSGKTSRRDFLKAGALVTAGAGMLGAGVAAAPVPAAAGVSS